MRNHQQLTPYRPFTPMASLRDAVDRLFEGFGRDMDLEPVFGEVLFVPTIDVVESDKQLKIVAELPGLEEKDVDVELTRESVVLRGEKSEEKEEQDGGFFRRERRFGSFRREIPLPWEVDTAKMDAKATFKHGVLTVTVPKPKGAPVASRRIPVGAA